MTPLDIAVLIVRSGAAAHRDPRSGLYVLEGTVPPTELTLAQYESGLRVLHLREKVALGQRPGGS